MQAYGIPNGGALIVVAIPADKLEPDDAARQAMREFRARIQVIIGDSGAGRIVATLDTLRTWSAPGPLGHDTWLSGYLTVPVAPGDWDVAVVVGDSADSAGTGERFRAVPVMPFDGATLRLSDPILGRKEGGLLWRHNGELVPLNPTNAWRVSEPVVLTYEVDGLVPARAYESRFELWKTAGHPTTPGIAIQFRQLAVNVRETVQRELSLRGLATGDYRLVVRIRDTVTHGEVTRERRIAIRN